VLGRGGFHRSKSESMRSYSSLAGKSKRIYGLTSECQERVTQVFKKFGKYALRFGREVQNAPGNTPGVIVNVLI
jgi:hypothetical protein